MYLKGSIHSETYRTTTKRLELLILKGTLARSDFCIHCKDRE